MVWYEMRLKQQEDCAHAPEPTNRPSLVTRSPRKDVIIFENTPFYDMSLLEERFGQGFSYDPATEGP
jgi:hypothetical protein